MKKKKIFVKSKMSFSPTLRADLPLLSPETIPLPGQKVVGYMIYESPSTICVSPNPSRLSVGGWLTSGLLCLVFWPIACLPCFLGYFYQGYQVPVYE